MKNKFRVGQIVYCEGRWKCKVVKDYGDSIAYIPIQGYASGDKGKTFTASKRLFKIESNDTPRISYPSHPVKL